MKIQFPNNSPVIQGHWMIPRGEARHSFTLQTCKRTNVTDDEQSFSSTVAFCYMIIVVSQCQGGSRAAAGSEPTHTHTQGSLITELERLVERRLFIGCLCLNWEQRWASDEDKTLSERVAFHAALVVIIITDFVVSYWLDHSTAKMTPFFLSKKRFRDGSKK